MSDKLGLIESRKKIFSSFSRTEKKIIEKICKYLILLIKENRKLKDYNEIIKSQESLIFNSKHYLCISLKDFLIFLEEFYELEDYTIIGGIIFLERFCNDASIILTEYNVYILIFISFLLSIKTLEDFCYENSYYSRIIGMNIKHFNKLEYKFITTIDYKLHINKSEYQRYKKYFDYI